MYFNLFKTREKHQSNTAITKIPTISPKFHTCEIFKKFNPHWEKFCKNFHLLVPGLRLL